MSQVWCPEVEGFIQELVLNRPERKNALTLEMYTQLTEGLRAAAANPRVRVVLLHAHGDAFCAGNDLMDFMKNPPTGENSPVMQFLLALTGFTKPIVVAVQGAAVGIGTTLLFHTDFNYASEKAVFSLPFVNLGLVPEAGSSFLLPRMVGGARAAELLLLGEKFGPNEALQCGIINAILPEDQVLAQARTTAHKLAAKPPGALQEARALIRQGYQAELRTAMQAEGTLFMARLASPELAEAVTAFFEKREPDFSRF